MSTNSTTSTNFTNSTIGHKTPSVRRTIVLSGIVFLVGINLLLLVPGQRLIGIILTAIGGLIMRWILRSVNAIRYTSDEEDLIITLPGSKSISIAHSDITSIAKLDQTPLTRRQHIGVKRLGDDRYITTSNGNLYEINVSDGRRIIISPRSPKKIFPDVK